MWEGSRWKGLCMDSRLGCPVERSSTAVLSQQDRAESCHEQNSDYVFSAARILRFAAIGNVSHAVGNTSRGARPRIFIKYGTVRFASNFAVSRNSHPSPFCTMSSLSPSSESDNFTISGKNIF